MTQPIRKPRRNGTPLTEAEIKALDNGAINALIVECFGLPKEYTDIRQWTYAIDYTADIRAAFTVDRPDWRWDTSEHFPDQYYSGYAVYVEIAVEIDAERTLFTLHQLHLDHKPTPADHAKARCIAALLLAAKIGE